MVAIRKAPEETRARTFDAEPLGDGMVGFQLDEPEPEAQAAVKAVEAKPARGGKAKERAAA